MGWEFSVSGPSLFSPDNKYCMFVHTLKHQCHSVVKVSNVSWHKNSQHEPDEAQVYLFMNSSSHDLGWITMSNAEMQIFR